MLATTQALALVLALGPSQDGGAPPDAGTLRLVERSVQALLELEEKGDGGEWPYEGAMRIEGQIPIGFRTGGTGVVVTALAKAPGLATAAARRGSLQRGTRFLMEALRDESMSSDVPAGFDLRLWGYIFGLEGLLAAREARVLPPAENEALERAITVYVARLEAQEIPRTGGWSYNRPTGRHLPAPAYSYVTADVVRVLFEAHHQGFEVDAGALTRGLDVLEAQRQVSGAFLYSGLVAEANPPTMAGAAVRSVACETALFLAGRSSALHVRGAVDGFLAHWDLYRDLYGRSGGQRPPFDIGPHHFLYAHLHAARAIELLPEQDRPEYRARLQARLLEVRDDKGCWNDRVFPRSGGYGTAAGILALLQPTLGPVRSWRPPAEGD